MTHHGLFAGAIATGIVAALIGACGGAGPNDIVTPRKLAAASGAPSIAGVVDLGAISRVPERGPMPAADTDGSFTVGELVRIDGSRFGKQPTIAIGGKPAQTVARTGAGAILVRVPTAIKTGAIKVRVSNSQGRDETEIEVKRYALALPPHRAGGASKVHVMEVGRRGQLTDAGAIDIPGARDLTFSSNGRIGLVAAQAAGAHETARLSLIAMSAGGGPRLVHELRLPGAVATRVASASQGSLAAIAAGSSVILVDITDPRHPATYEPFELGLDQAEITSLALSPDGRTLAVLVAEGNRLLVVDVSQPATPRAGQAINLLPNERVPLAKELGFGRDTTRLYAIAGDSREALSAGTHVTRLLEVALDGDGAPTVARTADIGDVGAPISLAVAQRDPSAGSTAIQAGDDAPAMAISAIDRAHLAAESGQAAQPSQVVRVVLVGSNEFLGNSPGTLGDIALSHDQRFTLAAAVRANGGDREFGVVVTQMSGGSPKYLSLSAASADSDLATTAVAIAP